MFSQTAEYALRAIVCLAQDPPSARTCQQIARTTGVPQGYLSKVLQLLVRARLVASRRGTHGGFVLASDPESLTILSVLAAVEPVPRIKHCPVGLHGSDLCPLHRRLDDAMQTLEDTFTSTTIAQVLRECDGRLPLCRFEDYGDSGNGADV